MNVYRFLKPIKPILRSLFGTITSVKTDQSLVALTFDDGPHPIYTPRLLNILEKHNAHATFFMVGYNAQQHPEIVKQVAESGHTIANHTWNHPSLPTTSSAKRRRQIRDCSKVLAPFGKRLFRPPHGDQSLSSFVDTSLLGFKVVTYSLHCQDWLSHDSESMAARLLRNIKPGDIIVLHDALWLPVDKAAMDRTKMLQALDSVLSLLKGKYEFVTIDRLLCQGKAVRQIWFQQPDLDWLARKRRIYGNHHES